MRLRTVINTHMLPRPGLSQYLLATIRLAACCAFWVLPTASLLAVGMSPEQRANAEALANNIGWLSPRQNNPELSSAELSHTPNVEHPLGVQTLSVELHERKGITADGRIRVYQFDYRQNRSRMVLVDLPTQKIVQQFDLDSVHLPLNTAETRFALLQLTNATDLMGKLQSERQMRGQPTLLSLNELDVKASIFEPQDLAHPCAMERCALLSLFDNSNTVFSLEPVVNLYSGEVAPLSAVIEQ